MKHEQDHNGVVSKGENMEATATHAGPMEVRAFPTGQLERKSAARDNLVRLFIAGIEEV
jgi:hypothetical protein